MKTNLCFLSIFPRWTALRYVQMYVIRIATSPTVCVWQFSKWNFIVFISRYRYVLNMAKALHSISNTVWAWKLHHNTQRRHLSPITDRQTVQSQICTDTLGHETNSKFCLRNTALPVACSTVLWTGASVVISEVFCVKVFCLSYFLHANEVFTSFWHLLLRVEWNDIQISDAKFNSAY